MCVCVCAHMYVLLPLVPPSPLANTRRVLSLYLTKHDCLLLSCVCVCLSASQCVLP